MRCLDLRANLIETEGIIELFEALKNNLSMFNLDMNENPGLTQKLHRQLALQMLANYTKVGQNIQLENRKQWKDEQRFFNAKLLVVEIPTKMIKTYAKKLEHIRNNCFEKNIRPASARSTRRSASQTTFNFATSKRAASAKRQSSVRRKSVSKPQSPK